MYEKFYGIARSMLVGDISTGSSENGQVDLYLRVIGGRRALVMRDPSERARFFSGIEVPEVERLRLRQLFPAIYPDEFYMPAIVPHKAVELRQGSHQVAQGERRFGWAVDADDDIPIVVRKLVDPNQWCRIYIVRKDYPMSPDDIPPGEHLDLLLAYGKNLLREFGPGDHSHELDSIAGCAITAADVLDMPDPDWNFV
jgi:hypothetical protein